MKSNFKKHLIVILNCVLFINTFNVFSQTYGLGFNGIDNTIDNRTELNLTPEKFLTFQDEFEISFDFKIKSINPNTNEGLGFYGYIFRIVNSENINIDLISSNNAITNTPDLNFVIGHKDSIITINYPKKNMTRWKNLKLKINLKKDQLIFYTPDTFFTYKGIGFNKKEKFKIIFGANSFYTFKTSDVPNMQIKDVKIFDNGKLRYSWALDQSEGNLIYDQIGNQKAVIKNPSWVKNKHDLWYKNYETEVEGKIMVAFDSKNEKLFLVGNKELLIYALGDTQPNKVVYKGKPRVFNRESRVIYNPTDNKIYCYVAEKGIYSSLDINLGVWKVMDTIKDSFLYYIKHNQYYNSIDNSIYIFGGYGRNIYNNDVIHLDISQNTLTKLNTNPAIFKPKYLAGLASLNDTIYILGGYGSNTGNQKINPESYYDLIGYSIKNRSFFKKFEIGNIMDDMCVSNSMWIDENTREYFGLIYSKNKFNNNLQLIKGDLDNPKIDLVGNKVDFNFLDIRTMTGLLYVSSKNKLLAYSTYLTDSATTKVNIYSINYPPNLFIKNEVVKPKKLDKQLVLYIALGFILFLGMVYLIFKRRKRAMALKETVELKDPIDKNTIQSEGELIINTPVALSPILKDKHNYQLIFFGGFQAFTNKQKNITNDFTPLLKELFLLIWLHTFKNNKGISTEKITEMLWYDKTAKSAQNNRAVNIAKLRTLLSELSSFGISKSTGYWKCVFNQSEIKSDYTEFLDLTSSKSSLTKPKIIQIIEISRKGPFLRNVQYEWLDGFKAEVSETIINILIDFGKSCDIKKEFDFIANLADSVFIYDSTNEDAMFLKCKALYFSGKHSQAKATFDKFHKEYITMYGQEYMMSFVDIVKDT